MTLARFHPAVADWFGRAFPGPTECQLRAWPAIAEGRHTLVAAPTGSGKTLAAFLAAIDDLVRLAQAGPLPDETRVLYVSPLKALSNDIDRNLEAPLAGIESTLAARGLAAAGIRTRVRTGDTPPAARQAMTRQPPHILVTTPESLYILLTSEGGRGMLETVRTVIVDEIHAVAGSKRGSHLALSLERLEHLAGRPLVRIGLSATQRPIADMARFLVGHRDAPCAVVDTGHARPRDLGLELPGSPLEAVMPAEVWEEIYDRLAALVRAHRTTLVFVNTRRLAERVARHLTERLGKEAVTSHHGSLAKEARLAAEQRLKAGDLRVLVATASLELGIDIGDVDLVCQLSSPRGIAAFLQRVGRSGHGVDGVPKGRLFPLSRDDLVESAAVLGAARRGELDRIRIPERPLDVLAQQIVAEVAGGEWGEDDLYALVRRAYPYRDLERSEFDAVVRMLADGFSTRRGRRSAYLHRDAVNRRLRARRGAGLTALTSGGAIPENADYTVVLEPGGAVVGTLNEDFAIESLPGDIFQLGNSSWRILRVESGRVRVEDARGLPPTIPFWLGEAPARSDELSAEVSRLRAGVSRSLGAGRAAAVAWLDAEAGAGPAAAEQIVDYLAAAEAALGVMPTADTPVIERFFDEAGGMQLVIHAPLGGRINRAWGLALRKRMCRKFNFELQAAATEDSIVLSLGETHSFALDDIAGYLHAKTLEPLLVQALLDAPMFTVRWRWNANVSLAIPRFRGGKKTPPPLQRMQADDLVAVVFPDQLACLENVAGDREVPDHPLVDQTIRDGLHDAMDVDGLAALLARLEAGEIRIATRDLTEPSPLAVEILNAKPYAFLDDAPLEERRTQAVQSRRWLDPETAADLGRLDPDAIDRVREEAWPTPRDPDELHDALVVLGFMAEGELGPGGAALAAALAADGRATRIAAGGARPALWVAAERLREVRAAFPGATFEPPIDAPRGYDGPPPAPEEALRELVRGRLQGLGPVTVAELAAPLGGGAPAVTAALAALESEGFVLRGRFRPAEADGGGPAEWCERRLLARIHRYTVTRLRKEIEPVTAADFMRFLLEWQGVAGDDEREGPEALAAVLAQLEGFEAAAAAWESEILPARVAHYAPAWLDGLCHSGRVRWVRLQPSRPDGAREGAGPIRTTPIAIVGRRNVDRWRRPVDPDLPPAAPSGPARRVAAVLEEKGASFFDDLLEDTGLLRSQLEAGLGELVSRGRITADGFSGLRALLAPMDRRRPRGRRGRRPGPPAEGLEAAGRWSRLADRPPETGDEPAEAVARTLLARYGVVFRRLLVREPGLPPWRTLLAVLRRLEARGEIRGGRFVGGFSGEQFAHPDAVAKLREVRRRGADGTEVSLSAADPLNLAGIVTPGDRVPALTGNRLLYRDGVPVAILVAGEVSFPAPPEPGREWATTTALRRHRGRVDAPEPLAAGGGD